jgi:general secretion pathway protein K
MNRFIERALSRSRAMGVAGSLLRSEGGIALVMVLWVMMILMVLVLSFSVMTKTEAGSTFSFKETVRRRLLAQAALERSLMELVFSVAHKDDDMTLEGKEPIRFDGRWYKGDLGKDRYAFRVADESGKININKMTDLSGILLNNMLVNLGIEKEQADTIVDSILDWKDGDDLHRLHGAEDEYYQSLQVPYKARNAPLETIEELLLVKGVTPEILYGTGEKPGLVNFITIYGTNEKVNVNLAAREVLAAIPGMTEDAVERLMDRREAGIFNNMADVQALAGEVGSTLTRYLDLMSSATFSIEGIGLSERQKGGYGIRAVVSLEGGSTFRYLYYKSPAALRYE